MMMLGPDANAYLDDSGSEPQSSNFVLAGFVAPAEAWARFSDEWKAVLEEKPRLEYFKMSEAESLKGQFLGWRLEQRAHRINELVKVVKSNVVIQIHAHLKWTDYQIAVKGKIPTKIDNPYFMLFFNAILTSTTFQRMHGLSEPVDFIFDDQGKIGRRALAWYDYVRNVSNEEVKSRLGSPPIFRDEKQFVPLQAADLLAWQLRRRLEDKRLFSGIEMRPVLQSLLEINGLSGKMERENLDWIVAATMKRMFPRTYPGPDPFERLISRQIRGKDDEI